MLKNVSIVMYSHSDYSDAWAPFFGQATKYMPKLKKYAIVDDDVGKIPDNWEVIKYDPAEPYNERFAHGLRQVETKLCIFHHEDMPLFEAPRLDLIADYAKMLRKEDISFIRLLKGEFLGQHPYKDYEGVYTIPWLGQHNFSVQPSLWKTDKLLEVYEKTKVRHIREFEPKSQQTCMYNNIHGTYAYYGEPKRGLYHYDSIVYPYVATAIVKGKWNLTEYKEELGALLEEYGINPEERGFV